MRNALLSPVERRVGRLRVRARDEADARHLAIVLADALQTATLPGTEEGRLLVVRKLCLARVSRGASSSTLALRLELAMREARLAAVPFALPEAATANAVIFPSRVEALLALARLHARGIRPNEWYWRGAVPEWMAAAPRAERWLRLIEAAHRLPEAAVVAAKILGEAVYAGAEDELLGALPSGCGAEWLRAEGWPGTEFFLPDKSEMAARTSDLAPWRNEHREIMQRMESVSPDEEPCLAPWTSRHREIIQRWEQRWGEHSERLVWLATLLAVGKNLARAADPRLPRAMKSRLISDRIERAEGRQDFRAARNRNPARPNDTECGTDWKEIAKNDVGVELEPSLPKSPPRPLSLSHHTRLSSLEKLPHANISPANTDHADAALAPCVGEFTSCGGLFFLVPVLERVGFAEFLAANPEMLDCGLPARLLHFVGRRAGMPRDDPLALALAQSIQSTPPIPRRKLPEAAREFLAWPPPRARLDSPLIMWLTILRRWCRRRARIGLFSLIRRPGRVAISETQTDIFFDLAAADVRLRRLALDVDPGWVPWLARVIRFHYLDAHESSR